MSNFSMTESFSTILPILITIAIGYVLRQRGIFKKSFVDEGNHFNYSLGFPLLLFSSTVSADLETLFDPMLVLYSVGSIFIMAVVGYVIFGKITTPDKQGALVTTTFRSDILLFSVYITGRLFGESGMAMAAMLTAFISPTVTTLSIIILNHLDPDNKESVNLGQTILRVLKNPFIIAVIVGIIYNCSPLPMPAVILDPLSDIGSVAVPLSLLTIGAQLDFKNVIENRKLVTVGVISRLIIVPLVFLTGAVLLGIRDMGLACLFAQYTAPATVSCFTFAEQMNSDAKLAGNVVIFSSVFSIVTIFIGMTIMTNLNLF